MAVCEHLFDAKQALVDALSDRIARRLDAAIARDGEASLFVSGGGTPVALFEALSRKPIKWSSVVVALVDERWVDEDHPASNTALVRRHLLINDAAQARYWPIYRGGDVADALPVLHADYPLAEGAAPTVAHLGLGGDMHTASIFPGAAQTPLALSADAPLLVDMYPTGTPANPPFHRVTLSKRALAGAGMLVLLMEGAAKLATYKAARELTLADAPRAPIAAFLADPDLTVEVYWS